MKKILAINLFIIFFQISHVFCSVQIEKVEYFIDNDPGFGRGVSIPVDIQSDNLSLDFSVNVKEIRNGLHILYIRAMDTNGNWSLNFNKPFYKLKTSLLDKPSKIVDAEYFFDKDPGFGNGNNISVYNNSSISNDYLFDLSNIANGSHILYFRFMDYSGRWSIPFSHPFFKTEKLGINELPEIMKIEYYFDKECEIGQGVNIPITSNFNVESNFIIDIKELEIGNHILYLRVQDELGEWSQLNAVQFLSTPINLADAIFILHVLAKVPLPESQNFAYERLENIVPDGTLDIKDAIKVLNDLIQP